RYLEAFGVMDLVSEYKETVGKSPSLPDSPANVPTDRQTHTSIGPLRLRRPSSCTVSVPGNRPGTGRLALLTAGKRDGEAFHSYAEAVRTFDWKEFYERWAGDAYVDFFRKDIVGGPRKDVEGPFDVLLIDSRTGVTEQGGICTHHLADVVVLCCGPND